MKQIFGIITMLISVALLAAGCSDRYDEEGPHGSLPIRLDVTTVELDNSLIADGNSWSSGGTTRATVTTPSFANNDKIWAYIVDNSGSAAVPGTNSGWTTYTYNGSSWSASPVAYYPGDYDNIKLTAIYPYKNNTTSTVAGGSDMKIATSFTVLANQTSAASYKASDLLTYSGTNLAPTASRSISMSHKMARIKVRISTSSTVAVSGIAINNVNLTSGTFSPTAGTLNNASAGSGTVTICGNATAGTYYCGVIPPQTHAASALITLTTASGNVTYTLGSTKAFESGKEYSLDLTVNTAAVGTTIDIGTWAANGNVTVEPTVERTNAPDGVVAVDLGLSVKWANMNVGATSVTGYGTYFAWGETSGYTSDTDYSKKYFDYDTYAWCKGTETTLTKYCPTGKQSTHWWDTAGTTVAADNKTSLDLADDAARANWGGSWRMPTEAEWNELINNTTKAWTDNYNNTGVAGYTFTGNGNTIFLPAVGYRSGEFLVLSGYYGIYWSSSLYTDNPDSAWSLLFNDHVVGVNSGSGRYSGFTVRPVQ